MSKVKLTTITPIHVGSGNVLHYNVDYAMQELEDGLFVGIIDPAKVYQIVGQERLDQWVSIIDQGKDIKEFVGNCSKESITIEDYCRRRLWCPQGMHPKQNDELREMIHDGFGHAYIPGSSIKGAIRTALLSYFINETKFDIDRNIKVEKKENEWKQKTEYTAKSNVEKKLFGPDPNSDCMRFVQVGDALFDYDCENVLNMTNLNIRERNSFLDESKHQYVEVVTEDEESHTFNINIGTLISDNYIDRFNQFVSKWNETHDEKQKKNAIHKLKIDGISSLVPIINQHTLRLLRSEERLWSEYDSEDGVSQYISAIRHLRQQVKSCAENECILRIGHASGWRFTTGAWTEEVKDDDIWYGIVDAARPNNETYSDFPFPKSRRINYERGTGMILLGFVKLTFLD